MRSSLLAEALPGTASHVPRYVLLEVPGPWGVDALHDARLSPALKQALRRHSQATGVRFLFIRRHGRRRTPAGRQVFIADTSPDRPRTAHGVVSHAADVLDLDLGAADPTEAGPGLTRRTEPVFLVCTHGRHDPCCAERGRPLARALTSAYPEQTWECSHLGGDRFAGNLLCFPHGLYYGRVSPEDAGAVAGAYREGSVDLTHLRGRAGYGFATQAAEWHLRARLGRLGVNDLRLVRRRVDQDVTEAVFDVFDVSAGTGRGDQRRWRVRIRTLLAPPHPLTCAATRPHAAPRFELLAIDPDHSRG